MSWASSALPRTYQRVLTSSSRTSLKVRTSKSPHADGWAGPFADVVDPGAFAAGSGTPSGVGLAHSLVAGLLIPSPFPTRTRSRRIAVRWQNGEKDAPVRPMGFSLPCGTRGGKAGTPGRSGRRFCTRLEGRNPLVVQALPARNEVPDVFPTSSSLLGFNSMDLT